jgi:hypothetical protein
MSLTKARNRHPRARMATARWIKLRQSLRISYSPGDTPGAEGQSPLPGIGQEDAGGCWLLIPFLPALLPLRLFCGLGPEPKASDESVVIIHDPTSWR